MAWDIPKQNTMLKGMDGQIMSNAEVRCRLILMLDMQA